MRTPRLFVALEPPPELKASLHARAAQLLAPCADDLRFHAAEDLHLTLVFLGATPKERVPEIARALRTSEQPLELEIAGGGAFPDLLRPRAVWAGVRERPGAQGRLAALAEELRGRLGLAPEPGPFRPHLTLARPRASARIELPGPLLELEIPGLWRASELVLFESRAGERPHYLARARVPLGS